MHRYFLTVLMGLFSFTLQAENLEPHGMPRLLSPLDYQIFQRSSKDQGTVHLEANVGVKENVDEYRVRIVNSQGQTLATATGSIEPTIKDFQEKSLRAIFKLDLVVKTGGWHRVEVTLCRDQRVVTEFTPVHIGIGEVFLVAGQSNSANYGAEKTSAQSDLVRTFNGQDWQACKDPQPGASGNGGSFMPSLGDALQSQLHVPIGFLACGIGSTSVREWLPTGRSFPHPPTLVHRVHEMTDGKWESDGQAYQTLVHRLQSMGKHGLRAVLWHQGESDANQKNPRCTLSGANYRDYLGIIIGQSRHDAGWEIPWMVAQVSYHSPDDTGSEDIREGQAALWHDGIALQGPDSDALRGPLRDNHGQGVHLSGEGLRAHAQAWAAKLVPWIESQP